MATVEGPQPPSLQGDWTLDGPSDVNFLRQQLLKGYNFPPAVYEVVSGQIVAILAGRYGTGKSAKPPTKRMIMAIGKFLLEARRLDIAAFSALSGTVQIPSGDLHIHQGTEVHVQGPLVCPPQLTAALESLPDDVLLAIGQIENVIDEESDSESPEVSPSSSGGAHVPGSDQAAD